MIDDHEPGGKRFKVTVTMILRQYDENDAWSIAKDMLDGDEIMTDTAQIISVEELPE